MKKQITSISLVQTAKVAAVMYLVLGVVAGVFLLLTALFSPDNRMASIVMAVLTPLIYALVGFVVVFIGAWVYNQVARRVGGIEFTVTEVRGDF